MSAENDLEHAIEAIISECLINGASVTEIARAIMTLLSHWTAEEPEEPKHG